jgi:nucleotide-binding universal stress UspA family protein
MSDEPNTTADDIPETIPAESIVVGNDGSVGSTKSLEVALTLAQSLNAPIVIVRCWSIDTAPHGALFDRGFVASFEEITAAVREQLITETSAVVAKHPSVPVRHLAVLGQPAETLLRLSAGRRMLVLGSRGLGGFASLLLGSVSEQCVHHASCPVLVVRP